MAGLIFFWGGPSCTKFAEVAGAVPDLIYGERQPTAMLAFVDQGSGARLLLEDVQPALTAVYSDIRPTGVVFGRRLPEPDCKHD